MSVEDVKRASGYLRGDLRRASSSTAPTRFGDDSTVLLKFHGIYQQDDRDVRRARAVAEAARSTTRAWCGRRCPAAR